MNYLDVGYLFYAEVVLQMDHKFILLNESQFSYFFLCEF